MASNFNREEMDLKQCKAWLSEIDDGQSDRICMIVGTQIERLGVVETIEQYVDASLDAGGKVEDLKFHRSLILRFGLAEILDHALHHLPGTGRYYAVR